MNQEPTSSLGKQIRVVLAIGTFLSLIALIIFLRGILAPFLLAFVMAYVLAPLVDRMEGRGMNRTLSILAVFIVVAGGLSFGLVKAGGKLTAEMIDLGEEFIRQEAVDREFLISNKGQNSVLINIEREDLNRAAPFSVTDPPVFPLKLGPGDSQVLRIHFAPAQTGPVHKLLILSSPDLTAPFELRLRGNSSRVAESSLDDFWEEEFHEEAVVGSVVFGAKGIDFGRAGPNLVTRISEIANETQPLVQPFLGEDLVIANVVREYGGNLAETLFGGTTGFVEELVSGITSGIALLVIVPFVAFFFLKEGRHITHGIIDLVPNAYFELCFNLLHQINGQIGGYIRGQLLAVSVVATMAIFGLLLVEMPYSLPVGLFAGLANMIPYLGPLIGILIGSIVALATGGGFGMVGNVILVFLIVQVIDNVLVQPAIVAKNVDLHPLVVLFVVMVGSQLMGIVGMLVAVPLTGIIKVSGQTIYQGIRGRGSSSVDQAGDFFYLHR